MDDAVTQLAFTFECECSGTGLVARRFAIRVCQSCLVGWVRLYGDRAEARRSKARKECPT